MTLMTLEELFNDSALQAAARRARPPLDLSTEGVAKVGSEQGADEALVLLTDGRYAMIATDRAEGVFYGADAIEAMQAWWEAQG